MFLAHLRSFLIFFLEKTNVHAFTDFFNQLTQSSDVKAIFTCNHFLKFWGFKVAILDNLG